MIAVKTKVGPIFLPALTTVPIAPWDHAMADDEPLPPLVLPAPHADDALAGLSDETREILDNLREGIARWDAAVAAHEAEQHLPDWAQPMRGERR